MDPPSRERIDQLRRVADDHQAVGRKRPGRPADGNAAAVELDG